jgi:hypothetical protein
MAAMARMAKASGKQAAPQASGFDEAAALEAFRDPCWRLGNLYSIRYATGRSSSSARGRSRLRSST